MRIDKLIAELERIRREHGNIQIRAYDRHGESGSPVIESSSFWVSGKSKPSTRWFVTAKAQD